MGEPPGLRHHKLAVRKVWTPRHTTDESIQAATLSAIALVVKFSTFLKGAMRVYSRLAGEGASGNDASPRFDYGGLKATRRDRLESEQTRIPLDQRRRMALST